MIDPRQIVETAPSLGLTVPRLFFAFLGAPILWALHLGAIYFLQTLDCISPWNGAHWAIAVATAVIGALSAAAGWTAWRLYRRLGGEDPSLPERDSTRFLLVVGLGGSVLFTATIFLEGLSPLLGPLCA